MNHLIVEGSGKTFPKMKSGINLKNDIWQKNVTDEIKLTVYNATDLIGPTKANQKYETIVE